MTRRIHDPETRARVVAALLSGQGVSQAAEVFQVPTSTVSRWRAEAGGFATEEDVAPLLLEFLTAGLRTLIAQHEVFADPDWLRKQSAHELAVLHGVGFDKLARLLELMNRTHDDAA